MSIPLAIGNYHLSSRAVIIYPILCVVYSCSDKVALTQGFVEASAIYLPTLSSLRSRKSKLALQIRDTNYDPMRVSSDVTNFGQTDKTSDISSSTSGGEKDDTAKLTETQKEAMSFQRLQLRKQLCYIGHGSMGDSGNSIWSGMTSVDVWSSMGNRLRPHVYTGHPRRSSSMDVHAVEVLLSRSMEDGESTLYFDQPQQLKLIY